ncbi:MAG: hypothetical protein U0869_15975 [Chloroflexota bacterium]
MNARRRFLALLAVPALLVSVAGAPTVAQSPTPATCPLISAEEVSTALATPGMRVDAGSAFYCAFGSTSVSLTISLTPSKSLDTVKQSQPNGSEVAVADQPGWYDASSNTLWAAVDGSLLEVAAYGVPAGTDVKDALVTIGTTASANAPAGPDEAAVAALLALLPATIGEEPVQTNTITGAMMAGFMDATDPSVKALVDALAAQGKTLDDLLLITGAVESDSSIGIIVVQVKGADANALLLPLVGGLSGTDASGATTTKQVGGKTATVIPVEPGILGYASGDIAFYTNDAPFAETWFATLP